ncbi:hypothetical protein MHYP_G00016170 [Metynnis hypsauchen]
MSVCPRSLLLVLVILYLHSCTVEQNSKVEECCFSFYTRPIPAAVISKYEELSARCPKPGLIFITRKGAHVCVDPSSQWVQRVMDRINCQVSERCSKLHEHEVKTKTQPAAKTSQPDPTKDQYNHQTEAHTASETLSPDPTTASDVHETKVQTQSEPKSLKPELTTVRHETETELQTHPAPETSRPDSDELNRFCLI